LAMDDIPAAYRHFIQARDIASSRDLIGQVCESTSGLAACAVMQGQLDEARKYVDFVWKHVKDLGWAGMESPGTVYRTCAEVFDALGETESAEQVIQSAYQALMEKAEMINVAEWRQSFLENVPDNRAIIEMWERRKV